MIMGHLDPFSDYGVLNSLAQTGCYLEWDVFGQEDTSFDTGALRAESLRIPSDVQRLQAWNTSSKRATRTGSSSATTSALRPATPDTAASLTTTF